MHYLFMILELFLGIFQTNWGDFSKTGIGKIYKFCIAVNKALNT